MPKESSNRPFDIQAAQRRSLAFAGEYLRTHAIGLPAEMDEPTFTAVMDAITRALVAAYAKGYLDARDE